MLGDRDLIVVLQVGDGAQEQGRTGSIPELNL